MVKFKVENLKYSMEEEYSNSNIMNIEDIPLTEDDINLDCNFNNILPKTITLNDLGKMLLVCASRGESDKVYELISRGAPFTTDWLGNSALHLAAQSNHLQTCEILLRAGISKDARTKVDKTPLHFAAACNHKAIVELLLGNKCDIDAKDMLKMTPLHWAVDNDHCEIVEILLNHNADPTIVSKFDKTAKIIAEMGNKIEILELLSNHENKISDKEQQEATEGLINELKQQNALSKSYNSPTRIDVDPKPPSINQKETYTPISTTTTADCPSTSSSSSVSAITPTFRTQAESEAITKRSDSSFFKKLNTPTVASLQQNKNNSTNPSNYNNPDIESQQGKHRFIPPTTKVSTPSTNNINSSRSASVLKILKEHHGISMLPIDDSDSLINSAIKSGRKVVISDGGKLILNDPTFNKFLNSTPVSKAVTLKSEVTSSTSTTSAPSSSSPSSSSLPAVFSSSASVTTPATTTTPTDASTTIAATLPKNTTTTTSNILNNIINNNNHVMKRKPTIILSSPQKSSSFPFHPNKVVKILSSDEFKQLCAEKNGSIKRLVNNSKMSGTFKVQTVTNPNELTQPKKLIDGQILNTLMSKGKIINNGSLIKLNDQKLANSNQKPGDIKYIINRNGQNPSLFKIVSTNSTPSTTSSVKSTSISPASTTPSPASSPGSPVPLSSASSAIGHRSASSSSTSISPTVSSTPYKTHSLILPIRNKNTTMSTNRTVTAVISPDSMHATNYISTSSVATKLLNSNNINNAIQRHQKASMPSMMTNQQMEKQIIELKKQQDELRKQLELSQKLNEDFRLRLEKLEAANEQQTRKFESLNDDR